jgi:hypothetical protein
MTTTAPLAQDHVEVSEGAPRRVTRRALSKAHHAHAGVEPTQNKLSRGPPRTSRSFTWCTLTDSRIRALASSSATTARLRQVEDMDDLASGPPQGLGAFRDVPGAP